MEPENQVVIDIEAQPIDSSFPEPNEQWYSAQQMMSLLRLSKADLQKSISKLQSIYGLNLAVLRRGAARATEYSQLALDATKLLNSGKLTQLRQLVEKAPTATSAPTAGALTINEYTPALDQRINQLGQNAATTSASLNQSVMQLLAQIATENQTAQQRDADLNTARINAAQNRGAANALAIFKAEQKAQNEVLAQLRAMQLGGNE
jgi:hypothetical protein